MSVRLETIIRPYRSEDAAHVSELICRCLLEVNSQDYSEAEISRMLPKFAPETMAKRFTGTATYVAIVEEKLVGTATLDQAQVRTVFVDPDFHCRGVGGSLMEYLERLARHNGVEAISLNSSITSYNFYVHLGYKKQGEIYCEIGGRMMVMTKRFSDSDGSSPK